MPPTSIVEFVAERLKAALDEGRLTLDEYDDRLQETYAAKTYGDLKALLADLPERRRRPQPDRRPAAGRHEAVHASGIRARGHGRKWVAAQWSSWISTA